MPPQPPATADYKEGQVWRYKTRPGEENSRLYIVRIENVKGLRIYHISLDGLRIASPRAESGFLEVASHLPVAEVTLDQSMTELAGVTTAPPDIAEGHEIWKEAFDKGETGVFNIPVAEIVAAMEQIGKPSQ